MFTEEIKMKPFLTGKLLGTFVVLFMSSQDVAVGKAGIADIADDCLALLNITVQKIHRYF